MSKFEVTNDDKQRSYLSIELISELHNE